MIDTTWSLFAVMFYRYTMDRLTNYRLIVLFGLFSLYTGAGGLRDVVLRVPVAVPTGSDATLICLYDLEGDQLYTVSWYKGRQEFFRYVLKELPHTRVFPLPGVNVDVVASGTEMVVLRDVQKSLSGKYRCEVSTDAPHFHTQAVVGFMHVIDELEGKPEIRLEKASYSIGDTLRANCTSPPATPSPNVTWYLNGHRIEVETVFNYGNSTISSLSVDLTSGSFPGGKLRLRCVADLFTITHIFHELWLDEDRPRLASVLGTRDSAGCKAPLSVFLVVMVMAIDVSIIYR